MNIKDFRHKTTPLSLFLSFLDRLPEKHIDIVFEDWDNMCGITIRNNYGGGEKATICFNFYDDGEFRTLISTYDEFKHQDFVDFHTSKINYMSLFDMLCSWWNNPRGTFI